METRLKIEGMSCNNCVKHVTHALESVAGVETAHVSLETKEALVSMDASTPKEALVQAVAQAGYRAE